METSERDYHINTRLERLFHADLEDENGDDILVNSLPEWLIGVIVVIILLVIAFFVMVISTIIKNKRKNQSACPNDMNLPTRVCDDLELGKISMIDPHASDALSFESKGKEAQADNKCNSTPETHLTMSEPCCSSKSTDSPMCAYKNPLFVDDDPEADHDEGTKSPECKIRKMECLNADTDMCCTSKGKSKKNKNSKHKASNSYSLNSVEESREGEKENKDLLNVAKRKNEAQPNSYSSNCDESGRENSSLTKLPTDCDSERVLVHKQDKPAAHTNGNILLPNDDDNIVKVVSSCNDAKVNNINNDAQADCNGLDDERRRQDAGQPETQHEEDQTCASGSKNMEDPILAEFDELDEDNTKIDMTERKDQNKSQRFSFIRMTLSEDGSEIETDERSYTKL